MQDLVTQFVKAFRKAVQGEMAAMREQMGPFEVPVTPPSETDPLSDDQALHLAVTALTPSDKLVLNGECTLTHERGERLVTIAAIDGDRLTLRCASSEPLADSASWRLVIYPWFLYERLLQALEAIPASPAFHAEQALALFGKRPAHRQKSAGSFHFPDLNESQCRAVRLCCETSAAFVWGPPGTGKTRTLSRIVTELLDRGHRVLVTSTTNAALDQALAMLARHPAAADPMRDGLVVRVGQTAAETHGASIPEILRRQSERTRNRLEGLRRRNRALLERLQACEAALRKVEQARKGQQLDMFHELPDASLQPGELVILFGHFQGNRLVSRPLEEKRRLLTRRAGRLKQAQALALERILDAGRKMAAREKGVVREARVVLATMTNMTISALLKDEAFDAVIVEEAGMAVLPTLFYCAGLAARRVVAVGDPRQLPPIVLSRDAYVLKAMGRSIFEVTLPDPHQSDQVVMLDTQYRMHPDIGGLVSDLFYEGRLKSDPSTRQRKMIADLKPFAGHPLVVVDTAGTGRCERADAGYSRFNRKTAERAVELAAEALADGVESVAIITPYAKQSQLIASLLAKGDLPRDRVECRTVHRFQGNERDMVILDTVDSLPERPGVLLAGREAYSSARHLLNVSLSRARGKLILLADVGYFRQQAPGSAIHQVLEAALKQGFLAKG